MHWVSPPQALKLCDALVDSATPLAGELGPVRTLRYAVVRQFGKFRADLLKTQANLLSEHNESDPAEHREDNGSVLNPTAQTESVVSARRSAARRKPLRFDEVK